MKAAPDISYAEILEGASPTWEYVFTKEIFMGFLRAFDDRSPIHTDSDYAIAAGLSGPVMHGSIIQGYVSHYVGMIFPGRRSLLLATELRFSQPSYLEDRLRLTAKVVQKVESQQVVVLHLTFHNETRGGIAATGRVHVRIRAA